MTVARVVLLGASNLTRGLSTVIESAEHALGGPLEVFAALGHGRSFGLRTNVFFRELPGILGCGLWPALQQRPELPTLALITDVGNDLLYHVPVETILAWVDAALTRLKAFSASTVLALPPICNLPRMSAARFYVMRTLLYRRCRLSFAETVRRAEQLERGLRNLGQSHQAPVVEMQREWYGIDPVHIRLRQWHAAWPAMLAPWLKESLGQASSGQASSGQASACRPAGSLLRWLQLRSSLPAEVAFFGMERRSHQPCVTLGGGSTVWLY